ncbi:nitroreductase family protein [Sporosarcina sp. FSL W7-1349]|uniref:nitroreductase family protein n=1 Tax=Bacillales TaxID=1385 RepID=UPI000581EBE4|nr:nitroreductase family protein [Bacillus sp. OxB-1]BAQ08772.1 nitroreductase [Bacillus sp. OxB-1]
MLVSEAIRQRREITKYQAKEIPNNVLEEIIESAYLSPTGNNLPSREFIVVQKREMLDHLAKTTPFVPWLTETTAAIVITGRPDVSKYWLQDASIACGFIWLSAVEQGLGAAFGAVYHSEDELESERRESHVRDALHLPGDRRVVAIIGLGYPAEIPAPKKHVAKEAIVFYENFQK